ncbi:protein sidekick-1 isoform X1 [Simochromis diagramma]|uniref:protein sidekick-1 isoform X1 n=1 Tax=Simochromis diagramma TaxID=43689 RepID=UPI001A7E6B91|nr:protein sidekick-1 isoform X1 [Simochromis diagramma]XP_039863224.1 protein sidekick-1 isoform X1 [Simochromis diagramma]XP_039863225.1 protein sidekick-1 isoform X1 [Simochromis diagramma]
MAGCKVQLDFSDSRCSSCASHPYYIILGLILVHYATLSMHSQVTPEKCKVNEISSKYRHCGLQPDGVRDLDCFTKYPWSKLRCMWKPGKHASKNTHILVIQPQKGNYCRVYKNINKSREGITFYKNHYVTIQIFENSQSKNCTKADFQGSPESLQRCDPPNYVKFTRHSGKLDINVSWDQNDVKHIMSYSVRYKALGSLQWNESPGMSQNKTTCRVENLNSSVAYALQIHCITNTKCTQCPWSEAYTVPSEVTSQPVIVNFKETDVANEKGTRLVSITWKVSARDLHDGYIVTIGKESGEAPIERINTIQPSITLILSYSAYSVSIQSFNNVSISPAVSHIIPLREDMDSMGDDELNVTVHNNISFKIYWKDFLLKKYVCYCAEWREEKTKTAYKSFYLKGKNYYTFSLLKEPLKPYKRYTVSLHVRPNKDTCNMKHLNNSEGTFASRKFYFMEGTPVSGPANIISYNLTQNSMVLQWSSIPEEDTRGFLLGYTIHYTENHLRGTESENNITVDPNVNKYKLKDLTSGTTYQVQISGFTSKGTGKRSEPNFFTTTQEGSFKFTSIIVAIAVLAAGLIFGPPIIKRAKVVLWPSIPNPGKSNTMQKIDRPCELELLEAINTLKAEEWETKSLHIIEKEAVPPATILPAMLPLLCGLDKRGDSPGITCNWIQTETDDATGNISPNNTTDTLLETQQTDLQSFPFPFPSGYTTMEMFQQVMPQSITAVTQDMESDPEDADLTVFNPKPGLDYVRQFSTSPVSDSDHLSTIL